jgi:hypothetical protein
VSIRGAPLASLAPAAVMLAVFVLEEAGGLPRRLEVGPGSSARGRCLLEEGDHGTTPPSFGRRLHFAPWKRSCPRLASGSIRQVLRSHPLPGWRARTWFDVSGGTNGDVAQLVEHLLCKQGVGGSSPLVSTTEVPGHRLEESPPPLFVAPRGSAEVAP